MVPTEALRQARSATVERLLARMTTAEKIGQLILVNGAEGEIPPALAEAVAAGRVGGVLNEVDPATLDGLQELARAKSRLGIPLLAARDVIHGFATLFPIPLGQAASFHPQRVEACAALAAQEAAARGLNWTFAPMLDLGRDPRWGRVAESFGEDPLLVSRLGAACVRGFQGDDPAAPERLAACAKHFAGYGASEGGRDYNSTPIPEIDLRQLHFPPFQAALQAGALTVMASFGDLNGVPASANPFLLSEVLRGEWGFSGFVVSDWDSVGQLVEHGLAADKRDAALQAAQAGLEMEMAGECFPHHLGRLVDEGLVSGDRLDGMVRRVLEVKAALGLLDDPPRPARCAPPDPAELERTAYHAALESVVLLENRGGLLPLERTRVRRVAVLGPLADEPAEQVGTWAFDLDLARVATPLAALRAWEGPDFQLLVDPVLKDSRDRSQAGFPRAVELAAQADVALLFLGEEAILSGEAHCRADIRLPGAQEELLRAVVASGTPTVVVLMAGRPLALGEVAHLPQALLCAWHGGSQAGPALRDLLFGLASPSGRLPVSFPRMSGQVPIFYSHKNTGRPTDPAAFVPMDQIPRGARQHTLGNTTHYLDAGHSPLFPFGHGLSYTTFEYRDLRLDRGILRAGEQLEITVELANSGARAGVEVVQLYLRDLVASVTRPVRELKDFRRVELAPGERRRVVFTLGEEDLRFVGRELRWTSEPGRFRLWVGSSSQAGLEADFELA